MKGKANRVGALVVVVILLECALFVPRVSAYESGDWQVWQNDAVEAKVAEHWKVKVMEEFRVGNDASELYEEFIDMELSHQASTWLTLAANYRHVYALSGAQWKMEKRPHFNFALSAKGGGFDVQDRSRFELRIRPGREDAWRYRNKLTVKLPPGWVASLVKPYVAAEVYVDMEDNDFNRYRLYAGFTRSVFGKVGVDLYYMRQSTESGEDWIHYHVAGLGLKGSF